MGFVKTVSKCSCLTVLFSVKCVESHGQSHQEKGSGEWVEFTGGINYE